MFITVNLLSMAKKEFANQRNAKRKKKLNGLLSTKIVCCRIYMEAKEEAGNQRNEKGKKKWNGLLSTEIIGCRIYMQRHHAAHDNVLDLL